MKGWCQFARECIVPGIEFRGILAGRSVGDSRGRLAGLLSPAHKRTTGFGLIRVETHREYLQENVFARERETGENPRRILLSFGGNKICLRQGECSRDEDFLRSCD